MHNLVICIHGMILDVCSMYVDQFVKCVDLVWSVDDRT